jgi:hypothetical protein
MPGCGLLLLTAGGCGVSISPEQRGLRRLRGLWGLQHVLAQVDRDLHRILPGQTCGTELVGRVAVGARGRPDRRQQLVELEVHQAVDPEVLLDLRHGHLGGEQGVASAGVHAVEARPAIGRRRHPQVYLGGAGGVEHGHHRLGGRAPDDRVVDDDQALALDGFAQRVELHAHPERAPLATGR